MTEDRGRLIVLYQQMYELTQPECSGSCPLPRSCCSPEYCDDTIRYAKERWGVELAPTGHARLSLLGDHGCVAAPHLRPACALHTCDINAFAQKVRPKPDPKWTKRYFKLREEIDALEWKLHG